MSVSVNVKLDVVFAAKSPKMPTKNQLTQWTQRVLAEVHPEKAHIALRIVDKSEMLSLNTQHRQKAYPTNILSFPNTLPKALQQGWLGDLVICADVIADEANDQHKPLDAHWAHMITHGILHLLGYDHENEEDAHTMESLEIRLLAQMGYENPYQVKSL